MRVVGCGGGSYFGLSFYARCVSGGGAAKRVQPNSTRTLSFLLLSSGGPPPALDCWLPCAALAYLMPVVWRGRRRYHGARSGTQRRRRRLHRGREVGWGYRGGGGGEWVGGCGRGVGGARRWLSVSMHEVSMADSQARACRNFGLSRLWRHCHCSRPPRASLGHSIPLPLPYSTRHVRPETSTHILCTHASPAPGLFTASLSPYSRRNPTPVPAHDACTPPLR